METHTNQPPHFYGLPLPQNKGMAHITEALKEKKARLFDIIDSSAWVLAKKNPAYQTALSHIDGLLYGCAGLGFVYSLLCRQPCKSFDLSLSTTQEKFFSALREANITLALVGGQPAIDERVHAKLEEKFPGLAVLATVHGYGDLAGKIALVLDKKPALVLVDMESPRQEDFMRALRDSGYGGVIVGVNNFFDLYLKADDFYPALVTKYHLQKTYYLFTEKKLAPIIDGFLILAVRVTKAFIGGLKKPRP